MHVQEIGLASIRVPPGYRRFSDARVKELADSILEVGLLEPIGVDESRKLIYGRHRIEAMRLLGRSSIHAVILNLAEMQAEIATIDENILRVNLTEAEYAKALKRRKELYEALHPETKKSATLKQGPKRQNVATEIPSFAADIAAKTGTSRRTVERSVALAEKLDDQAVDALGEHPVANNKTELKKLAELPADEQRTVVKKLTSGKAQSVSHAVTGKPPRKKTKQKRTPPDDDKAMSTVEKLMRDVFSGRLTVAAARLEALAEKLRKDA